ncbi:hypothetical protein QYF61_019790 [Mycteria americana]|uniref:Uncharacterized protein n=1 Tax=Mycteria americana TaxID=33587 RepID=A0AAN7MRP7_MYCAM|nr:hypothetical protein QYF61_019780 [Mycteria americana]KAK4811159.1 hypothetical protein QYF61_019790 [Mycteria americana]
MFYDEGGETLEQVAQRGGRCPIIGSVQGQVGRGFDQPNLVKDVPAHGRGFGLDDAFYDSMITVAKTATNHHFTHETISIYEQQV